MTGRQLLPGPMLAFYLAGVQWLISALFMGKLVLFWGVVPLAAMTVLTTETGLLVREVRAGDPSASGATQRLALWRFQLALVAFAAVAYLAGSRRPDGQPSGDRWQSWEWIVTLAVGAIVALTWFVNERRASRRQLTDE